MPDLLHEYWENEEGGAFSRVSEHSDRLLRTTMPGARHVFSLHASSVHQSMQLYYDQLGYGEYRPYPEDSPDCFYTDEEAADQEAYLQTREVR